MTGVRERKELDRCPLHQGVLSFNDSGEMRLVIDCPACFTVGLLGRPLTLWQAEMLIAATPRDEPTDQQGKG